MKTLLVINSSGRVTRSITRHLTSRFAAGWLDRNPGGRIVDRDVGQNPPPAITEAWIAEAFASAAEDALASEGPLATSNLLIDEIIHADAIVVGAPMYNFGMPAHLKAYIDQIVRVGRTFAFDATDPEPYRPLLSPKPLVVITSAGDGAIQPGGALAHLNFLEPHLRTVFEFIGLTDAEFIRVGYDEYQDGRVKRSLAAAESAIHQILDRDDAVIPAADLACAGCLG